MRDLTQHAQRSAMTRAAWLGVTIPVVAGIVGACAGTTPAPSPPPPSAPSGSMQAPPAQAPIDPRALLGSAARAMGAYDEKGEWPDERCASVADAFSTAAQGLRSMQAPDPEIGRAFYHAGLAYQRCGEHERAMQLYQAALSASPSADKPKLQIALHQARTQGGAALDAAIQLLEPVAKSTTSDPEPLVQLSSLQLTRDGLAGGDCGSDLECARKNLLRALEIRPAHAPAYSHLGLYYYRRHEHRERAIAERKPVDGPETSQQLLQEAGLMAAKARLADPAHANAYYVLGLVDQALSGPGFAVNAFRAASNLDRGAFHIWYAYGRAAYAVRDYERAAEAWQQAFRIRPSHYETCIATAAALRETIPPVAEKDFVERSVMKVRGTLELCKKLSPDRAEAFFETGYLLQELGNRFGSGDEVSINILQEAIREYEGFLQRAGGRPELAGLAKRADERKNELVRVIDFIRSGKNQPAGSARPQPPPAPPAPPTPPQR